MLIFLLFNIHTGYSQGNIEVIADTALNHIVKVRYERSLTEASKPDTFIVQGYRVQVYFTNDRNMAYYIKEKAARLYPEFANEVYVVYQSPNYKVRIGNFVNEKDVREVERMLAKDFENVFIVRDKVTYIKQKNIGTEEKEEVPEE